ncbi:MAG TPA: peptide-methionine (S)-S-oxide reductase MsrA [Candidatus Obscuribacterales bacterium]
MKMIKVKQSGLKLLAGILTTAALLSGIGGAQPGQARALAAPAAPYKIATFAGGCFWSIEGVYDDLPGVVSATSGYSGGSQADPSYDQVSSGGTGHAESVRVVYDPKKVSFQKLLDVYWHQINPTQRNGQFYDEGSQYRTIVFYHNDEQKRLAMASKASLEKSHRFKAPIVTAIQPASPFYAAEEHHQNYAHLHRDHYMAYRVGSGRDAFFKSVWGSSAH